MNNVPSLGEPPIQKNGLFTAGWSNWWTQIFQCLPWKKAINVSTSKEFPTGIDFPLVAVNSQSSAAVTVTGARQGDAVQVTPYTDTTGIIFTGVVTARDTVTIYAKNFSGGGINPASTQFRIIVIQD